MGGWVDLVMIRYISLLLFIGLAFWGCEDSENNATNETGDFYISNEFLRCGQTYQVTISLPSNDTIGIVYNIEWNNLIKKQPRPVSYNDELIRVDTIFTEYDQCGNAIFTDYKMLSDYPDSTGIPDHPVDSVRNTYTDYWKLIQSISYYKYWDNSISNFTWDGLTRIKVDDPNSYTIHNEYGISLGNSFMQVETMDDGKRIKSANMSDGSISWTYEWDGYSYEMWMNSSTNQSGYQTGTIDEYANEIEYILYDCSVDPCVPTRKTIFEFDCTMFEPIPM